jgi:hypothetical protein
MEQNEVILEVFYLDKTVLNIENSRNKIYY